MLQIDPINITEVLVKKKQFILLFKRIINKFKMGKTSEKNEN